MNCLLFGIFPLSFLPSFVHTSYTAYALLMFHAYQGVFVPYTRNLISKTVNPEDKGKYMSVLTSTQLLSTCASSGLATLYGFMQFKGWAFLIAAILHLMSILVFLSILDLPTEEDQLDFQTFTAAAAKPSDPGHPFRAQSMQVVEEGQNT